MAEQVVSPGVFLNENDQSFISQGPIQAGAALIGPTVLGKVNIPTLVTSYSDFVNKFGSTFVSGGEVFSYLTSISAYDYFNKGGKTLLVTRVASGSWTPASSTTIGANFNATSASFALQTITPGVVMNSSSSLDSFGALASGSNLNVRWEISQASSASGTFTLLVRRGDDTTNQKNVLETFSNLSLDPLSPNYVERAIGNQTYTVATDGSTDYLQVTGSYANISRYVRVSAVNYPTPNYFDNAGVPKPQYTGSLPRIASGSFNSATGTLPNSMNMYQNIASQTQGLTGSDYTVALSLLRNKDEYQFNVISTPGLLYEYHSSTLSTLLSNTQDRGDSIAVVDLVEYGSLINAVTSQATGIDNSYAATYWPWVQMLDPGTGKLVWVPASTVVPGVYAYTDSISQPWFAPAGFANGALTTVTQAERKLPESSRNELYLAKVNPIATFPGQGIAIYGQKTLQTAASALDRVNVRRLLIALKSYIGQVANTLVFQNNTLALRNSFLATVNPYLESVKQKEGLFGYKVVMDDSNNTAATIDQNKLIGQIYIQPSKAVEFVILDFVVQPTGATFPQ
jgi:uncharacterized protein